MLILSRVCAEFHDKSGKTIFSINPQNLLSFMDAPEAVQEDPLFDMLLSDGSLEAVRSVEQKRILESDPVADATIEGKKKRRGSTSSKTKSGAADSPSPDPDNVAAEEKPSKKATIASPAITSDSEKSAYTSGEKTLAAASAAAANAEMDPKAAETDADAVPQASATPAKTTRKSSKAS